MDTHTAAVAAASRIDAGAALVEALQDPACYPHAVDRVEVIETHISYVLLAGEFAYKVKKALRLPFLDFSTPAARRRYCEEELRLNRRAAPGIYLEVVEITGDPARPRIGPGAPVLEHAVKMRRFPQEALFSVMARTGQLDRAHVDALADGVADLHAVADRRVPPEAAPRGNPALDNFAEIAALGIDGSILDRLAPLRRWTESAARELEACFAARAAAGFVRECHGDLHLANVALVDGRPTPFDGIEFSLAFRWIDVASDVAFAAMDLYRHRLPRLAARFVSRYLERTGDYGALRVLRYYLVYRAMVRAKVAAIAMRQALPGSAAARERREELLELVSLADGLSRPRPALLVVMHGLPASGKTTVSERLLEALGAVRLRSDVERKRLHRMAADARAGAAPGEGIYTALDTQATYERLAELARTALAAGYPVIVDATFARREERARFRAVARDAGAAFHIVSCIAPEAVLRARIQARAAAGRDASDAGLAVLEQRMRDDLPPSAQERARAVDTTLPMPDELVAALAARLASGILA